MILDPISLLAGADEVVHVATDGVLGDITLVADLREPADLSGLAMVPDLAPVGVVGPTELQEEPLDGAFGRVLNRVCQLDPIGLLAPTEEERGPTDNVAEQFRSPFEAQLPQASRAPGHELSLRL